VGAVGGRCQAKGGVVIVAKAAAVALILLLAVMAVWGNWRLRP
jgi:hypothetical protein